MAGGEDTVPFKVLTVLVGLVGVVQVLDGGACAAPHHTAAPAIATVGGVSAGVAFAAEQAGEFAAENAVEIRPEADAIGHIEFVVGPFTERLESSSPPRG